VEVMVFDDAEGVSQAAARHILDVVQRQPKATIGLATGGTQLGVYRELVDAYRQGAVSFAANTFFMLDEYAGIEPTSPNSFQHVVRSEFLHLVDATPHSLHILDGTASDLSGEAERFEHVLRDHGGIDLQLLGIGTNSHIAFNEPGSAFDSRTRVVQLHDDTIHANSPYFAKPSDVPRTAISQGLGTIMEARTILLTATGMSKALAVHAMVEGEVSPQQPASILQHHPHVVAIFDTQAASRLSARV
jgi:glucosamine-6-phosphate deaminase